MLKIPMQVREATIEQELIDKLGELKYTLRPDIRDRAALEANFRQHFQALNRVTLTDAEFARLLDEIVTPDANPPFSYRWEPKDATRDDPRFANHGVAPKSAADFAFLLHGLHYLKDDGVMAIILPHGVLFRGGKEADIRRKLLDDGHIDTVIGLPANLFYSTGIPVCILVLKKCKKPDDVLFINAAEHFTKGKRQNQLSDADIARIVDTYRQRPEKPVERYARRVSMEEILANDYNLNISRYVSTAEAEKDIHLAEVHADLVRIEREVAAAKARHNIFLVELGLPPLP